MFRLPRSLDLQVAPTAEAQSLQGSQAVYTTHSSVGYLPRDVASLRVRHEQLTRLDFPQLDCSLVGCPDVLKYSNNSIVQMTTCFFRYLLSSFYCVAHRSKCHVKGKGFGVAS